MRAFKVTLIGDKLRDSFEMVWTCPTLLAMDVVEEKFFYIG